MVSQQLRGRTFIATHRAHIAQGQRRRHELYRLRYIALEIRQWLETVGFAKTNTESEINTRA